MRASSQRTIAKLTCSAKVSEQSSPFKTISPGLPATSFGCALLSRLIAESIWMHKSGREITPKQPRLIRSSIRPVVDRCNDHGGPNAIDRRLQTGQQHLLKGKWKRQHGGSTKRWCKAASKSVCQFVDFFATVSCYLEVHSRWTQNPPCNPPQFFDHVNLSWQKTSSFRCIRKSLFETR